MSRPLDAALSAEIAKPDLKPFLALWIDLPDPVAVWTGTGTISFGGRDWIGAGAIGSLDSIDETTDGAATGIKVMLNQIPSEFRDDIAEQATKGAAMEVWLGTLDETWQAVIAAKKLGTYKLDTYDIDDGGETLSVTVTGESRARDQNRPTIKRFTDEYQQRKYPGDRYFEYLPQLAEVQILWAKGDLSGGSVTAAQARGTGNR